MNSNSTAKATGNANNNANTPTRRSSIRRRPKNSISNNNRSSNSNNATKKTSSSSNNYTSNGNNTKLNRDDVSNTDSNLVPIWALAALSVMKKQERQRQQLNQLSVSTNTNSNSNSNKKDGISMPKPYQLSYPLSSSINLSTVGGVVGTTTARSSSLLSSSSTSYIQRELYPSNINNVGVYGGGIISKSEFSREKQWIRSGSKWVLTGYGGGGVPGSANSATGGGGGNFVRSTSITSTTIPQISGNSISTTTETTATTTATSNPSSSFVPYQTPPYCTTTLSSPKKNNATIITTFSNTGPGVGAGAGTTSASSVISSSPSLLYTRRRIVTTASGFPYMPSLHLSRSSSSLGGGGTSGTNNGVNNYSNNPTNSGNGGASLKNKVSSNSNINAKRKNPYATTTSTSSNNNHNLYNNHHDSISSKLSPLATTNTNTTATAISNTNNTDYELIQTQNNDFDFSGYDSESNIGERLKEWKVNYVKNLIQNYDDDDKNEEEPRENRFNFNLIGDNDDDEDDEPYYNNQHYYNSSKQKNTNILQSPHSHNSITTTKQPSTTKIIKRKSKSPTTSTKTYSQLSPPKISYHTRAYSDSFPSGSIVDSEYDSDSNNIIERLQEWKKEQYRKSGILDIVDHQLQQQKEQKDLQMDVQQQQPISADHPKDEKEKQQQKEGKLKLLNDNTSNNTNHAWNQMSRHHNTSSPRFSPVSTLSKLNLFRNQSDTNVDTGYESGSTTCDNNERLKEWKEQQYELSGILSKKQFSSLNSMNSNSISNIWEEIPLTRSVDSYDSEEPSNRQERLKEWKQQFVNLPLQEKNDGTNSTKSMQNEGSTRNEHPKQPLSTIHSATIGFFPVTSPGRRKDQSHNRRHFNVGLPPNPSPKPSPIAVSNSSARRDLIKATSGNAPKHPLSSLPPLTPPRCQSRQSAFTKKPTGNETPNQLTKQHAAVSTAANFLFNLSQPIEEDSTAIANSSSTNTDSILCSPPNATKLGTACRVIPHLPSTEESLLEVDSPPSNKKKRSTMPFFKGVESWKPIRSQSSISVKSGDHESHCSLNPHDGTSFIPFREAGSKVSAENTSRALFSWENCLFVRAEGARTGRLCLSSSHLIFLYEDDHAEATLFENGWSRTKIDEFLQEENGSPVRCATPINIPLDASGEGGGVELIGAGDKNLSLLDMLEDGLNDSTCDSLTEEKENLSESALSFDEIKCDVDRHQSVNSGLSVNFEDTQYNKIKQDSAVEGKCLTYVKGNRTNNQDAETKGVPQVCVSTSSSYSSYQVDDSLTKDETMNSCREGSLCEESYEFMLNECIVRAMKAEAQRRMTEIRTEHDVAVLSSVASYSPWDRYEIDRSDTHNDFGSLVGNQTNVSSFSEPDLDIDPDEERRLYISGVKDSNKKFAGIKWPLHKLAELYDRRYMTRDVALEIFSLSPASISSTKKPSSVASVSTEVGMTIGEAELPPLGPLSNQSIFLVIPDSENSQIDGQTTSRFGFSVKRKTRRDTFVETLKDYAHNLNDAFWQNAKASNRLWIAGNDTTVANDGERSWTPSSLLRRGNSKTDVLHILSKAWRKGLLSNYDYLLRLNAIAGRSFHDPGNYPVMPWVLSNFTSASVPDLTDERNFRDLTKPMGALCPERSKKFLEKYASLCSSDTDIPPFMYGSHYSNTGGVVLHYLVRKRPFAGLHRQLQVSNN